MEPIPKHEQKQGMLTSELYQSMVAHPEHIDSLIKAITVFDRDILYKRYNDELQDYQKGRQYVQDLLKLYIKTTELETRLHNLNKHIEGNTVITKEDGFAPYWLH